jgi:endonuclease/exonuclease/phosphatase family metal-dependent hydrolase
MSRRVSLGIRVFGAAAVATMLFLAPASAVAQTTVVLDAPDSEVTDAYIRGGSYANTVHNNDALATKAYSTSQNQRRALLKFDTETRVPRGAQITSARLTLTLKRSDPETRRIGVYRVTQSFQESQTTWYTRKSGYRWTSAGSDLSSRLTDFSIGTAVGTKVTVDVTSTVQAAVNGSYGSRYTRLALLDIGSSSNTSYKEFYSSETSTASNRPTLTVVYGGSSSSGGSSSTSTAQLRVLDWNTHYGVGTDGRYDLDRIATYIARYNPDVISLNEVTRRSHYNTSDDQVVRYRDLLRAKTGRTWYYYYRTDNGASTGVGNAVLSRFPISSTSYCQLSARRVAVNAAINVNGRLINVWSTHLDSSTTSSSMRITEVRALTACTGAFAQQRIIAGDFNARDFTSEIGLMESGHYDGWAEAASDGTAVSYAGNTQFGATRNTRIDYVWMSKAASALSVRSAQVYDTRSSTGVMPSDHKPLMVVFNVR